jgi:hypothetical protein
MVTMGRQFDLEVPQQFVRGFSISLAALAAGSGA